MIHASGFIDVLINGQASKRRCLINTASGKVSYEPELLPGERYFETTEGVIHIIAESDHPTR